MKCIIHATVEGISGKTREKGILKVYKNGCEFVTATTIYEIPWADLLEVKVHRCQVMLSRLFFKKKPAIRFHISGHNYFFIVKPRIAKQVVTAILKEQKDEKELRSKAKQEAQEEELRLAELRKEELRKKEEERKKQEEELRLAELRKEELRKKEEERKKQEEELRLAELRKEELRKKEEERKKQEEELRLAELRKEELRKKEEERLRQEEELRLAELRREEELRQKEERASLLNVSDDNTLYVHKGQIVCLKRKHAIEQATAIMNNVHGREVRLNVNHCCQCRKFFIHYEIYKRYRDQYGTILGDIRMVKGESFNSFSVELATESTLHLCGYTVSQNSCLTMAERQAIIVATIENDAMSKGDVINLLRYLIDLNHSKEKMRHAVEKWEDDLAFTLEYNIFRQNRFLIDRVVAYRKNQFILDKKTSTMPQSQKYNMYVGKTIIHVNPKYGRGVITGATNSTITIRFDNGASNDFDKKILSTGQAYIVH